MSTTQPAAGGATAGGAIWPFRGGRPRAVVTECFGSAVLARAEPSTASGR